MGFTYLYDGYVVVPHRRIQLSSHAFLFFLKLINNRLGELAKTKKVKKMKKKITSMLLIIFAVANVYSQNYNISFAASGASTTVGTVKVDNLTQNTTLTLNGNDILHLGPVGINETKFNTNNPMIYPNPMHGKAELSFFAEQDGDVQITIIDISGKEILHIGNKYPKGNHKFQLNGLKQGMYLVNIKNETYSLSLKLISQNSNQNETAAIEYLGFENETSGKLKNTNTTVNMAYTNGDRLLFKGTSGNYSNIITDILLSSKTITFNYIACSDFDNNNYATVQIGNQIWMAENLKTTHYKNGTAIPNVTNNTTWNGLTTGAYCDYNNTPSNSATYGRLYNWFAVNTGNLCPTGWHVPTDAEWTTLTDYLGGDSIAGGKLKATTLWSSIIPNIGGATNETGFTALPGGARNVSMSFGSIGWDAFWWSATEYGAPYAWYRHITYYLSGFPRNEAYKVEGISVRCIKN